MLKRQYAALRQFYSSDFRHDLIITAAAFGALLLETLTFVIHFHTITVPLKVLHQNSVLSAITLTL